MVYEKIDLNIIMVNTATAIVTLRLRLRLRPGRLWLWVRLLGLKGCNILYQKFHENWTIYIESKRSLFQINIKKYGNSGFNIHVYKA